MALNKDVLGAALLAMADNFNNINVEDLAAAKEAFWKGVADEIIKHIKTQGVVNTTGTAAAQTGTIT